MTVTVELYDHQKRGVTEILSRAEGFGIFADPGTGKTLTAIAAIGELRKYDPITKLLIVCPKTLKYVWSDEFKRSKDQWKVTVLDGVVSGRAAEIMKLAAKGDKDLRVFITNYESVDKLATALSIWKPDIVIADESQKIKGFKTKQTKALKRIPAKYKWAITGTPMLNNPLDVWSQFDWIRPGHLYNSYYAFRNRYANVYTGAGFPKITGWKNLDELSKKMAKFSWRVTKDECLDLPEKIYITREFDLSLKERSLYDDMATEMIAEADEADAPIVASTALVKLLRLQQITSGFVGWGSEGNTADLEKCAKMDALRDLMDELEDQSIVIWCRFKRDIARIMDECKTRKIVAGALSGDTKDSERERIIKSFQASETKVIVGHPQVGGVGVTLTAASNMIYYSNTWSMGERVQSEDRLHRIGQKNHVTIYDLAAKRTIDTYILKVLKNKSKLASKLTGDDIRAIARGE